MKFSIVTPVFNCKPYLAETIESVISQEGDFEIEYIIMDGGSTDGTVEIIKTYEQRLNENTYQIKCKRISFAWQSKKDEGMYDAINNGFSQASGDIYAWINADDRYEPDAFQTVSDVLSAYPEIDWIKGLNKNVEYDDSFIKSAPLRIFHQKWLQAGIYNRAIYFVEQDSVFWRASLWKMSAPIPKQYKYAGDYWLWIQFARHARLWSLNKKVSIFRKRADQLSQQMSAYQREQKDIQPHLPISSTFIRVFFRLDSRLGHLLPRLFAALYRVLFIRGHKEYYIDKQDERYVMRSITYYKLTQVAACD